VTVVTGSCAFLFCTRGRGRNVRPAFPAPLFPGRKSISHNPGTSCRGIADARLNGCAGNKFHCQRRVTMAVGSKV
jgi:hypothetical protein